MPASSTHIIRPNLHRLPGRWLATVLCLAASSCSTAENSSNGGDLQLANSRDQALVLALAVLGEDPDGKPKPLPARMVILERTGATWNSRFIEDAASTAFHKAMAYQPAEGPSGVLTLGGAAAAVKFWVPGKDPETLWEAEFGGQVQPHAGCRSGRHPRRWKPGDRRRDPRPGSGSHPSAQA